VLELRDVWSENGEKVMNEREATNKLVEQIDRVRKEITLVLTGLIQG